MDKRRKLWYHIHIYDFMTMECAGMKTDIMGIAFDNVTMQEALQKAREMLSGGKTCYAVTPNAEIAYEALKDEGLRALLNEADLVLPDGAGVVLASKILKTPLKQKVAGVDFADGLLGVLAETGRSVYLLGSKPGIAEKAAEKMLQKHPGLTICGMHDGYFKDEAPIIEAVNEADPDVLFVCLGAPKQELFMAKYGEATGCHLLMGLGGSMDIFAGVAQRAPEFYCKHNLAWVYRLVKNPSRIGRMMKLPLFLVHVAGAKNK